VCGCVAAATLPAPKITAAAASESERRIDQKVPSAFLSWQSRHYPPLLDNEQVPYHQPIRTPGHTALAIYQSAMSTMVASRASLLAVHLVVLWWTITVVPSTVAFLLPSTTCVPAANQCQRHGETAPIAFFPINPSRHFLGSSQRGSSSCLLASWSLAVGGPKRDKATTKQPQVARVTVNGKSAPAAKAGQTVLQVARRVGVQIPTYCRRGACGTCVCYLNYHKVHACKETIPSHGRVEIQTMD
jgi:hypothetical protein